MTTLARRNSSIHKIREYTLPRINLDDEYDVIHVMQEGWRGRLLLVEHKRTRHEVVLKAIHKEATSKLEFFREFHYNYYLSPHTHILNAYDVAFQTGEYYIFAQEYAPFGDLTVNLCETGLGEMNVKKIAPQIVSALEFMHSKDLVHRNINTDNVLVFNIDFSDVKLCDFGSTRKNGSLMKRKTVSLPYAPPEIVDTVHNESFYVSTKQDVWQLGVLLYILLTGALPWQKAEVSDPHYLEFIHWRKRKMLKTPKRFSNFTARLLKMFKRLFDPNPEKRASVREVYKYLEDKWLIRALKSQDTDLDSQSICYSTFSLHSSKVEKDKVLHALKAHGIETTVDRIAKRKRIREWIQNSLSNNLIFEENNPLNKGKSETPSGNFALSSETQIKSNINNVNLGAEKPLESINLIKELESSTLLVDATNQETIIKRDHSAHTRKNIQGKFRLSNNSIDQNKFQAFTQEKSNDNKFSEVNEISSHFDNFSSNSYTDVKRTSSFQEKLGKTSSKVKNPCNNYKEMHSSKSHYHQSPTRNSLSSSKIYSKSQKLLYTKVSTQQQKNLNEASIQTNDNSKLRQYSKSPVLGRSRASSNKRSSGFQRSRSLARNHNYRFNVQKLHSELPSRGDVEKVRTSSTQDSDEESSHSDASLSSVIPAVYYQ